MENHPLPKGVQSVSGREEGFVPRPKFPTYPIPPESHYSLDVSAKPSVLFRGFEEESVSLSEEKDKGKGKGFTEEAFLVMR